MIKCSMRQPRHSMMRRSGSPPHVQTLCDPTVTALCFLGLKMKKAGICRPFKNVVQERTRIKVATWAGPIQHRHWLTGYLGESRCKSTFAPPMTLRPRTERSR
ncbi:hypothetical protein BN2475_230013 [Paraburkholderia ribeironis]|uniref:Uncharacterized protein n=1 Tax=Paraburkholderia ribeironis TaxID=1247936 RepID=A0A1N7RXP9_9BURK|nr:hypothetical protein BN2475_230013 [Paraburkholderia ribeironis]